MNSPMKGTSIQDLQNSEYSHMQASQFENAHEAADSIQQAQHLQYYLSQKKPINKKTCGVASEEATDMDGLAQNITQNMPQEDREQAVTYSSVEDHKEEHFETGIMNYIPEGLRLPLLIVLFYLLLSHTSVKQTIGNYVPQINPDMNGKISIVGIIIYGIILATLVVMGQKLIK